MHMYGGTLAYYRKSVKETGVDVKFNGWGYQFQETVEYQRWKREERMWKTVEEG